MACVCDTLCLMKTVSIRQLHEHTGKLVREAAHAGEIYVTDRGQIVAKLTPQPVEKAVPYFARRKLQQGFRKLLNSGMLRGGTDSTLAISEERENRV